MIQIITIYILSSIIIFFIGYFTHKLTMETPEVEINASSINGVKGKPIITWKGKINMNINADLIQSADEKI